MSRTGRPPKNPALKVVRGNFKKSGKAPVDAKKAGKKVLAPDSPDRPTHLDKEEREIWDQLIAHLKKIGTLQKCDQGSLEAYCTAYATMRRNKKALAAHRAIHGHDFYSTDGRHGEVIRVHPAVGIIERSAKNLKSLAIEFGMTPASRKSMGYDPSQLALPFDEKPEHDPTSGMCS